LARWEAASARRRSSPTSSAIAGRHTPDNTIRICSEVSVRGGAIGRDAIHAMHAHASTALTIPSAVPQRSAVHAIASISTSPGEGTRSGVRSSATKTAMAKTVGSNSRAFLPKRDLSRNKRPVTRG
jgi:hypothetical protein